MIRMGNGLWANGLELAYSGAFRTDVPLHVPTDNPGVGMPNGASALPILYANYISSPH